MVPLAVVVVVVVVAAAAAVVLLLVLPLPPLVVAAAHSLGSDEAIPMDSWMTQFLPRWFSLSPPRRPCAATPPC